MQPEPCAAPSGWRSPAIRWMPSPSKSTSVASSRCPPVTTTTSGPERVQRAGERLDVLGRRPAPASTRASGRFGVITVARGSSRSTSARAGARRRAAPRRTPRPSPGRSPPACPGSSRSSAVVDGSDGLGACRASRSSPRRRRCPSATARTCSTMNAPGTGCTAVTPTVFCAVSAVIAVIPWTPQRANAFRSAWIPAPPPESEPAIDSTAGIGRAHAAQGRTRSYARSSSART